MTEPTPSEFIDGKHWADVIGCDTRAGLGEIQRAAYRRAKEVIDGPLRGEYLGAALERISAALTIATRAKAKKNRGPKGLTTCWGASRKPKNHAGRMAKR